MYVTEDNIAKLYVTYKQRKIHGTVEQFVTYVCRTKQQLAALAKFSNSVGKENGEGDCCSPLPVRLSVADGGQKENNTQKEITRKTNKQ